MVLNLDDEMLLSQSDDTELIQEISEIEPVILRADLEDILQRREEELLDEKQWSKRLESELRDAQEQIESFILRN